jgi:hypothetical protein
MKSTKTKHLKIPVLQAVILLFILSFALPLSAYPDNTETIVHFKPEFKIKRIPNVGVTIYSVNENEKSEEYLFKDFNADVVLLLYRRLSVDQIAANLADKYYLSEADSRRGVKRVINVLDEWGLVTE